MTDDAVGAELATLVAVINPTLEEVQKSFRNGDRVMVLQHYDILLALPELQMLAALVNKMRVTCKLLEQRENLVNVLDPKFLSQRLKVGSQVTRGDARISDQLQAMDLDAASGGATYIPESVHALYEMERDLEYVWALSLLTVLEQAPEEEEHHQEIVDDFERLFERSSEMLRAMNLKSLGATETIYKYSMLEGQVTPEVLMAALLKHQPESSLELAKFIEHTKSIDAPITLRVAELLEKSFVKCMKNEDVESVFELYIGLGLVPLSIRMFTFLLNSKSLKRKTVLDYYDLMLDYGIAPEPSLFRILCKQCCNMVLPSMHFTQCLKKYTLGGTSLSSKAATTKNWSDSSNLSPNGASAPGATTVEAVHDSLRRNDRAYFAMRLSDLAKEAGLKNLTLPLMEGMKVLHRAKVEGTPLEGDARILSMLLIHYCNGTTPLKDLVFPFEESLAYHPNPVLVTNGDENDNTGGADTRDLLEPSVRRQSLQEVNAFDFELENDEGELLDDLSHGTGCPGSFSAFKDADVSAYPPIEKHSEGKERKGGSRRRSNLATPEEEARYALTVFAQYGSRPNNEVLRKLSFWNESLLGRNASVLQLVAEAVFNLGQESCGEVEAVSCYYCIFAVNECVRHRNRQRLVRLLRIFVEQYYTYTKVFHASWDFDPKSLHYHQRNSMSFRVLIASAMKIGPLDWALGLFVLLIIQFAGNVSDGVKARLYQVRTTENSRTPHAEVLDLLSRCNWERNRILCCDKLMMETHEVAEIGVSQGEDDTTLKKRPHQPPPQEAITHSSAHVSGAHTSLFTYLHTVLRELNVSREVANFYRETLQELRQAVLAAKRCRKP